ncbi:MAG: phosphotransferase [Jatrophihabitans sp.]|uniref:phosphotransferase n=1 Tax=Jatrophihabitans sp. TaxID=1932789 RepID=UPI003911CE62
MRHGYTNVTERRGDAVYKTYAGPDAPARCATELRALTQLHGVVPVPAVISNSPGVLVTGYVSGQHGQDLLDAGRAHDVLTGCGRVLRRLHEVDPAVFAPGAESGVIRHGDFGPNNVIFDSDTMAVTALLDWEFSGIGAAIDDIAWCEWIVRMHHPDAVEALPAFFVAYGWTPAWDERKRAMLNRCRWLESFCKRWGPRSPGVHQWQVRTATTASWEP